MPILVINVAFEATKQSIPLHNIAVCINRSSYVTQTDYAGKLYVKARYGLNRISLDILEPGYIPWEMDVDVAGNAEILAKIAVTGTGPVALYASTPEGTSVGTENYYVS